MWNTVRNYLGQALAPDAQRWRPLLAVYYLTYACDLRCPYCSDGAGRPYWSLDPTTLSASEVLRLLGVVRRYTDYLVLTGGEPLQYPQLDRVLAGLRDLRFDGVIFTTNGVGISPALPALATAVDHLVFSLDTLDRAKADRCFGRGAGVLERVLAGIAEAAAWPQRRYEILLSAVATPDNLADLYAVYDYALEHGFRLAVCPVLQGVKPHPALRQSTEYRALFDFLIAEKKKGRDVYGTVPYLEHMRDLRQFACRPSTVLAISPTGEVFYPCLELGHLAGNLLAEPDLDRLRRQAIARFGPEPSCDNRCQSACALGFALLLANPLGVLPELGYRLRGALTSRTR